MHISSCLSNNVDFLLSLDGALIVAVTQFWFDKSWTFHIE